MIVVRYLIPLMTLAVILFGCAQATSILGTPTPETEITAEAVIELIQQKLLAEKEYVGLTTSRRKSIEAAEESLASQGLSAVKYIGLHFWVAHLSGDTYLVDELDRTVKLIPTFSTQFIDLMRLEAGTLADESEPAWYSNAEIMGIAETEPNIRGPLMQFGELMTRYLGKGCWEVRVAPQDLIAYVDERLLEGPEVRFVISKKRLL